MKTVLVWSFWPFTAAGFVFEIVASGWKVGRSLARDCIIHTLEEAP